MTPIPAPVVPDWLDCIDSLPDEPALIAQWIAFMNADPKRLYAIRCLFDIECASENLNTATLKRFVTHCSTLLRTRANAGEDCRVATLIRDVAEADPRFYVAGRVKPPLMRLSRYVEAKDYLSFADHDQKLGVTASRARSDADAARLASHVPVTDWSFDPNRHRPWWASPAQDISGLSATETRNVLGLANIRRGILMEIRYPAGFAPEKHSRPSTIDSGGEGVFRPVSNGGVDEGYGRTVDLASPTLGPGARELVHSPFERFSDQFEIAPVGRIEPTNLSATPTSSQLDATL